MSDIDVTIEGLPEAIEQTYAEGDIFRSEEQRGAVLDELLEGYHRVVTDGERERFLSKLQKWRRQREARPEQEEKDFPWKGASNVVPPVALQNTNGIYSMLKRSLAQRKPFFVVEPMDKADKSRTQLANSWATFLNALTESPDHINLRPANRTILYDLASLGTQFVKIPWMTRQWNFKRRNSDGTVDTITKTIQDCPAVIPLRLENLIIHSYWADLQRAPWVQEQVWMMEHELLQAQAQGLYNSNIDQVLNRSPDDITEERRRDLERMGFSVQDIYESDQYCIVEAHKFHDIDGDGVPEDIVVWYDPITGLDLRSEFNDLGIRPYVRLAYLDRPHEMYGMGTGWIIEPIQEEIEALHNMRIDGTMIGMLQMYVTRRGALPPNERFRPLKQIEVDDPQKDFLPVKFPDIGYGTLQAELMAKEYGDRSTMYSDYMAGFENRAVGTRGTASGTMFLAGQNQQNFTGAVMEGVEESYSEIGRLLTFQLIRNHERAINLLNLVGPEHHANIKLVLSLNVEDIPQLFNFRVWTTDIEKTEDTKQRAMLMMFQLYMQYGQQIFQLLPILADPKANVPPVIKEAAAKFIVGGTKMMEEAFEGLGEHDAQRFLPYFRDLEFQLQLKEQAKNMQLDQMIRSMNDVRGNGGPGEARPAGG